jgi:hypothetical protein
MFSDQRGGPLWNYQSVGGCSIRSGLWPKVAQSRGDDLIDGACTNGMHKIIYQKIIRSSASLVRSIDSICDE